MNTSKLFEALSRLEKDKALEYRGFGGLPENTEAKITAFWIAMGSEGLEVVEWTINDFDDLVTITARAEPGVMRLKAYCGIKEYSADALIY